MTRVYHQDSSWEARRNRALTALARNHPDDYRKLRRIELAYGATKDQARHRARAFLARYYSDEYDELLGETLP